MDDSLGLLLLVRSNAVTFSVQVTRRAVHGEARPREQRCARGASISALTTHWRYADFGVRQAHGVNPTLTLGLDLLV
jgi:hypothetical protein